MNRWITVLVLAVLTACHADPNKTPDLLNKEEMPAHIKQLFGKLEQHPDSTGLRLQLVNALDSLGAIQQANAQMDSLIRKDSLNYGLWYRKAMIREELKDTPGALRSYRYAIRIYPAPDALLASANLLAEKKDSTALLICKQVAGMRIGREYTAHCSFISGIYYARSGNKQKAIENFNACISADFNYAVAYMEKGFILFDDKKTTEALQVFQTLVTVKNSYADGYYWMAKCQEKLNNTAEAIINYRKSLTLDPSLKEATAALQRLEAK